MLGLNSNDTYNTCQPPDITEAIEDACILQSNLQYSIPDKLHLKWQDGILPEKPELLAGQLYLCPGFFKPVTGKLPGTIYPLVKNIFIHVEYSRNKSGDVSRVIYKAAVEKNSGTNVLLQACIYQNSLIGNMKLI